jgi:hypothetical protein
MGTKAEFVKETAILPTEMLLMDYFKCGNRPQWKIKIPAFE